MVTRKRLYYESCHFLALSGIPYKYNQCHTTLEGLSSVCEKLQPASSNNNERLKINAQQKFTQYALLFSILRFLIVLYCLSSQHVHSSDFSILRLNSYVYPRLFRRTWRHAPPKKLRCSDLLNMNCTQQNSLTFP